MTIQMNLHDTTDDGQSKKEQSKGSYRAIIGSLAAGLVIGLSSGYMLGESNGFHAGFDSCQVLNDRFNFNNSSYSNKRNISLDSSISQLGNEPQTEVQSDIIGPQVNLEEVVSSLPVAVSDDNVSYDNESNGVTQPIQKTKDSRFKKVIYVAATPLRGLGTLGKGLWNYTGGRLLKKENISAEDTENENQINQSGSSPKYDSDGKVPLLFSRDKLGHRGVQERSGLPEQSSRINDDELNQPAEAMPINPNLQHAQAQLNMYDEIISNLGPIIEDSDDNSESTSQTTQPMTNLEYFSYQNAEFDRLVGEEELPKKVPTTVFLPPIKVDSIELIKNPNSN